MTSDATLSIVIPALNENASLVDLLPKLCAMGISAEIIVVDDGSSEDMAKTCNRTNIRLIRHPYTKGNGATIKTGARVATGDVILFMDADGQHRPEDIPALLAKFGEGYDMVVGARVITSQAGVHRAMGNTFLNHFASWMVGHPIPDLTSGFRVVTAEKFRHFLYMLPNGFSYPTTITMSFFRAGLSVGYVPIHAEKRTSGKSHIRLARDGLRFLLIIFKVGTLYSPLRLFTPIALSFFLTGFCYYIFTYVTQNRFTNMSALLLTTSVLIFLIGLISEQITTLVYKDSDSR